MVVAKLQLQDVEVVYESSQYDELSPSLECQ